MNESTQEAAEPGTGAPAQAELMSALLDLLGREPTGEERAAWSAMGPSHRRRTAERVAVMRRWFGDRDGLTAADAARTFDVTVKYFYQMASAWKRTGTLAALGALTTARATRGPRLDAAVTNAIQANVAKVVDAGDGLSVEALRRNLEQAARETLQRGTPAGTEVPDLPSARTLRTFVERELVRRVEQTLPGRMVVLDCCPVTMRRADGTPHVLFSIIDRGTGLVLGHSTGDLAASASAYASAARSALRTVPAGFGVEVPWASGTERLDLTFGEDEEACRSLWTRYRLEPGLPDMGAIDNPKRFGAAYRRIVGDRVGRILFRPTWLTKLPPLEKGAETFDDAEAAVRADADVAAHNRDVAAGLRRKGERSAPENLIAALRVLAA